MQRIRVLHVYKFYLPHMGGIERSIQLIVDNMRDDLIDFRVLACSHNASSESTKEVIGGVQVVRTNSIGTLFSTPLSISFFVAFRDLLKSADILHIHSPFPLGEISYLLFRPKGKKLVVTYHADISQTRWACFAPFYKHVLRSLLERADRIVVTSPAMIQHSPQLYPFQNKCRVIPLAMGLEKLDPSTPEKEKDLRDRLRLSSGKIVLFVGRLTYQKGLNYLIDAMQEIEATLILIGDGELKEKLIKKSSHLGINDKIHFVGRVSEDELPVYYSIADVFVLPSISGGETFAVVQLEAMAFGVPVVNTSLLTGVTFVSPHNETGLTVPPRDSSALAEAINKILKDDALRLRFSDNARKRARLFSLDRMLIETRKLYAEVIDKDI